METTNEQRAQNNHGQFIFMDEASQAAAQIIQGRLDTYNIKRRQQLLEIRTNICYLVGEQNIRLVGDTICPLDKEREINSVANVILPAVQKDAAMATQVQPRFEVVPAGTDQDDRATAIAARKIHKYLNRIHGEDMKRGQMMLWYDIAGVGWRKVYYNHNARVIGINPGPQNEDGSPNPSHIPELQVGAAIMEGEVELEVIPPNQLIWDYRESELEKLQWIIHCKQVSASYVLDRFGADIHRKLSGQYTNATKESRFEAGVLSRFQSAFSGRDDTEQRLFTVKDSGTLDVKLDADKYIDYYEYWERPTKSNPAGMFAIMLGNQVVLHEPYPVDEYPHQELPFVPCAPMSLCGVMNGAISRISQARPLQREYNRLRSQIGENIDVMDNAIIMAPRQAKLRYRTLDNGAGNIIEYDGPVGKPHREPGVPMSGQVFIHLHETKLAIDNIFAFHEPSRGVAPRNIDSGKGIQALQNADIAHMGPIVTALEKADERVAYQRIVLAVRNYNDQRQLNIVGDDYQWTVYQLDKKNLQGKVNVIVRPGSSMPQDRMAEGRLAMELWGSGLLGDPADPELRLWTLEQMHYGNNDNLLQKHSKQKNFARMEFVSAVESLKAIELPEGAPDAELKREIEMRTFIPLPNTFDNDMVHLADHNEFLLDNYWKFRGSGNPLFLQLLQNMQGHIQVHAEKLEAVAARQRAARLREEMLVKGKTIEQLTAGKRATESSKSDKKGK